MKRRKLDRNSEPFQGNGGYRAWEITGGSDGAKLHSYVYCIVEPGKRVNRHFHKHAEESYFFIKGRARMRLNDEVHEFGPHEGCFIEPGDRHELEPLGDEPVEFLAIAAPAYDPSDSFEE